MKYHIIIGDATVTVVGESLTILCSYTIDSVYKSDYGLSNGDAWYIDKENIAIKKLNFNSFETELPNRFIMPNEEIITYVKQIGCYKNIYSYMWSNQLISNSTFGGELYDNYIFFRIDSANGYSGYYYAPSPWGGTNSYNAYPTQITKDIIIPDSVTELQTSFCPRRTDYNFSTNYYHYNYDTNYYEYNGRQLNLTTDESLRKTVYASNLVMSTGKSKHKITLSSNITELNCGAFAYVGASEINLKNVETIPVCALEMAIDSDSNEITLPGTLKKLWSKITVFTDEALEEIQDITGSKWLDDAYFRDNAPDILKIYYDGTIEDWVAIHRTESRLLYYPEGNNDPLEPEFFILDPNGNISHNEKTYSKLTEIIVPNTVTKISDFAFSGIQIHTFTLPNTIKEIGKNAFNVTGMDLSLDMNSIHSTYFVFNTNILTSKKTITVYYDGSLEDWLNIEDKSRLISMCSHFYILDSNGNITHNGKTYYDLLSLTSITIPNTITKISDSAFEGFTTLQSISMQNVVEIGDQAFFGCLGLTTISCPNIEIIGNCAFGYCTSLASFPFGTQLREIGDYCFLKTALTSVSLTGMIESIGEYAFQFIPTLTSLTIRSKYIKHLDKALALYNYGSGGNTSVSTFDVYIPNAQVVRQKLGYNMLISDIPHNCVEFIADAANISTITIPLTLEYIYREAWGSYANGSNLTMYFEGSIDEFKSYKRSKLRDSIKINLFGNSTLKAMICSDGSCTF